MKKCEQCRDERGRPRHGYYTLKDRLLRRAGGCNWLDWMAVDNKCPHCGGLVRWFQPTALGAMLDEMPDALSGVSETHRTTEGK